MSHPPESRVTVEESVAALRAAVELAGGALDGRVFDRAGALFQACRASSFALDQLRQWAPQYGRNEFLLPVDEAGRADPAPAEVLANRATMEARDPEFRRWFAARGESVLAARWLCHLAGLRHRTVELFIDHPSLSGYTLVQVRSPAKREYPACFDLPVAGHVVGEASVAEGLDQEMGEELALDVASVDDLRVLGNYVHAEGRNGGAIRDVERRTVYRCRLRPCHLESVRFADGEVAALAIFALPDLQIMLRDYPERFASGLAASFPLYFS